MRQTARSDFSHTASNLRLGLTAKAVMPSEPSIPTQSLVIESLTRNVLLSFIIYVIDDNVVTTRVKHSLVINIKNVVLHICLQPKYEPIK